MLSGALIGAHAVYERLAGLVTPDGRVLGIYQLDKDASPNYLALFLAPIAVMGIAKLVLSIKNQVLSRNKQLLTTCYLLLTTFVIFGVLASGSRSGIGVVGLLGSLLLVNLIYRNTILKKILTWLIILGAILAFISYGLPDLSASDQAGRVSSSNNIRYEIWKTTVTEIVPKYWLTGVGLGNYQNVFGKITSHRVNYDEYITPRALTAHNLLLATWMNVGLIGLVGLIIIFYSIFRSWYSNKNNPDILTSYFLLLTAIFLLGIVDTPIFKNDLGALFWIAVLSNQIIEAKNNENLN